MKKLYLLNGLFKLLQGTIFYYLALLLKDMGFDGWHSGIVLAAYALTPILFSIPAGLLNDRVSSRLLITLSFAGYGAFCLLLGHVKGFIPLTVVFVIGGASYNFLNVSLQALALKVVGEDDRGRKLGIFQGLGCIGFALGLPVGGYLMAARLLVSLLGGAAAIYFLLALYALTLQETTVVSINLLEYAHDLKQRNVLLFCAIYSVFAFHWGSEASSLSLFLSQHFSLSKFQIGLYMAPPIAILGLTAIATGFLMDRKVMESRGLVLIAFLASGTGQILMIIPQLYASMGMRILHEMGDGIATVTFTVAMSRMFDVEKVGGLSSAVTFTNVLSQSLGILVFSSMGDMYGYQYPMIAGGLSVLAAGAFVAMTEKRLVVL